MASIGLIVGATVHVVQNLGRGSIIVAVRGGHVALGRGEASKLEVEVAETQDAGASRRTSVKVALAGQPNAGKSTVFNALTGLSQHVGNWPGKTVERKAGRCKRGDTMFEIVDLPGTYSLTANSVEERIARDHILNEHPDVVVDIVDVSALERSLYLLCELLALPVPVVVGLNMLDVAEQYGIRVEPHVLEAALGLPVVPMIASEKQGVEDLILAVERVALRRSTYAPQRPQIREDHTDVLARVQAIVARQKTIPYPASWVALKLLEGDDQITKMMREHLGEADWADVHKVLKEHEDAILAIVGGRYEWIERMVRAAITRPRAGQITLTERVDRVATHPVWGLTALLGVLGMVFWLTYGIGAPLQRWMDEQLIQAGGNELRAALSSAPWWVTGLLTNGVLAGAGMVFTFLPILLIFFTVMGLFESVGYMARAAYVMDRFMHWMGLHGKSFVPLCVACGCNVPGVLCTRTIDSPRARLLTILLTPLVPCTARLAVLAVLAPIFFGPYALWASVGLIALNLLLLMATGFALHKFVLAGEHVAFIMELPLYHLPNARAVGLSVWHRLLEFLKNAGGIIVVVSVLVWVFSALPHGDLETSYLASFGRFLTPVGAWMGLDWRMMVALLTSVVAKENTVATLGVLYNGNGLGALASSITSAAAFAFLVVQLTFVPCVATVVSIRQETRSWWWTATSVGLLLILSLTAGVIAFQVGHLL